MLVSSVIFTGDMPPYGQGVEPQEVYRQVRAGILTFNFLSPPHTVFFFSVPHLHRYRYALTQFGSIPSRQCDVLGLRISRGKIS